MLNPLPQEIIDAWNDRDGPLVLATVDTRGVPNIIYAGIAHLTSGGRLAVTDNYFEKTLANIQSGSAGGILWLTRGHKSYQVKGIIDYCTQGPMYDEMLTWADPKHPRKGVAVLNAEAAYSGSRRIT